MRKIKSSGGQFITNRNGGIAPIFALSALFLMTTIGLAVDGGRVYGAFSKLTAAADAAALAAAKLLDDDSKTDADIRAVALKYYQANAAAMGIDHVSVTNFLTSIDRAESSVTVTANASVATSVGQLAGIDVIDFQPLAKVIYKSKKIELALVLDTTGSMGGAKLDALKLAAKDLVDTLFAAAPKLGAIKVSLVPYAASVNAGTYVTSVTDPMVTGADNCVVERDGASAYTNDTPFAGGYLGVSNTTEYSGYSCPAATVIPLTDLYQQSQRDWFKSKIDDMIADGGTAGHVGTAWGWYTLSPEWNYIWPSNPARAYNTDKVLKVVILMTDGIFNTAYRNNGLALLDTPSTTDKTVSGSSGYQALQLCNNMRNPADQNEEIQIYTVAFQSPAEADALLSECSGNASHFSADNAGELSAAFQRIATNLSNMRLAR